MYYVEKISMVIKSNAIPLHSRLYTRSKTQRSRNAILGFDNTQKHLKMPQSNFWASLDLARSKWPYLNMTNGKMAKWTMHSPPKPRSILHTDFPRYGRTDSQTMAPRHPGCFERILVRQWLMTNGLRNNHMSHCIPTRR